MKVWPIILDARPSYVAGSEGRHSLLGLPIGGECVLGYVQRTLRPVTDRAPLVIPTFEADAEYDAAIRVLSPSAVIIRTASELTVAVGAHELGDAWLVVDARYVALRADDFANLLHRYLAAPRAAHHLVAMDATVGGTKESVVVDASGRVRRVARHYEDRTWPFLAGLVATLVPTATGLLRESGVPTSLDHLRQLLVAHGVPGEDVPVAGPVASLADEAGLLTANEHELQHLIRSVASDRRPVLVGTGHSVDPAARIEGRVVLHTGAHVAAGAMILGPAVVGPGARVLSGARVAHAVIAAEATVPAGMIVRGRVWSVADGASPVEAAPPDFAARLKPLAMIDRDGNASDVRPAAAARLTMACKRVADVVVAGLALLLLAPVLLLVAVAVRLESAGSPFYGDKREGLGGRVFRCWKFRTMFVGADAVQADLASRAQVDGPHFKLDRDPRVTRLGRLLRATNLDELPQLFNVLVGEMSLVGPRPSPFRENQVCVPWRAARLSVRPGITGFWQVCRHDRAAGDFHQWIEYDLLYVQHLSLWLDAKILLATAATLGGKLGHVPAAWLVPLLDQRGDSAGLAPHRRAAARARSPEPLTLASALHLTDRPRGVDALVPAHVTSSDGHSRDRSRSITAAWGTVPHGGFGDANGGASNLAGKK